MTTNLASSGNTGADVVIDGMTNLAPVLVAIIVICLGLSFIVAAAWVAWQALQRITGKGLGTGPDPMTGRIGRSDPFDDLDDYNEARMRGQTKY